MIDVSEPREHETAEGEMCARSMPHRAWYEPARYVIRVRGVLRPSWADRLGGMQITPDEGNADCTMLEGALPDQAALIGVLQGLYDLGLPLLLVELVATVASIEQRATPAADTGGSARPVGDDDERPFGGDPVRSRASARLAA